jgi:heme-degrading monooxygenase HmoA
MCVLPKSIFRPPRCGKIIRYPLCTPMEVVDVSVYTLGIWLVKPGHEDDFVKAWKEMADQTHKDYPGGRGLLMRDRDVPNRFISTGPWASLEQVEQWRASAAFTEGLASIRDIIEHFEPHTLDEAAKSAEPAPVTRG